MSHFTELQVRNFLMLFKQFQDDADIERCKGVPPAAGTSESFMGRRRSSVGGINSVKKLKLRYRLTPRSLLCLLPHLGPFVTIPQVCEYISQYDSSMTGSLDFEDFLEFLRDYEIALKERKNLSRIDLVLANKLREQVGEDAFIQAFNSAKNLVSLYSTPEEYLASIQLDDPGRYFQPDNELTREIRGAGKVTNPRVLKRTITVRAVMCKNLDAFLRIKKRKREGIEYESIDALLKVTLAGITRETSAQVGESKPEWGQDLHFPLVIPAGDLIDIRQWVERQNIEFSLYDLCNTGQNPHKELIGTAFVPLTRVLLSVKKPLFSVLKLTPPDCTMPNTIRPIIDVYIVDQTLNEFSWAAVLDCFPREEEIWFSRNTELTKDSLLTKSFSVHHSTKSPSNPWSHYNDLMSALRQAFNRRSFNVLGLDENKVLRFLPCFVRPMECTHPFLKTAADLAYTVASIPYRAQIQPFTPLTKKETEKIFDQVEGRQYFSKSDGEECQWSSSGCASWKFRGGSSSNVASHSFFASIMSPSSMLFARKGSLIEHAILLCSLFLGKGMNAFVAVGQVKKRPYVWVVTIDSSSADHTSQKDLGNSGKSAGSFSHGKLDPFAGGFLRPNFHDKETMKDATLSIISYGLTDGYIRYPQLRVGEGDDEIILNGQGEPLIFPIKTFAMASEVSTILNSNNGVSVTHWDALTGACYSSTTEKGFYFERLESIFNHKNIYFNIQKTDIVVRSTFSWDLSKMENWMPFITPGSEYAFGSVIPCYAEPSFLHRVDFCLIKVNFNEKVFLEQLIEGIKSYRCHFLCIMSTRFHREASMYMQSKLEDFEQSYLRRCERSQWSFWDRHIKKSSNKKSQHSTNNRRVSRMSIDRVDQSLIANFIGNRHNMQSNTAATDGGQSEFSNDYFSRKNGGAKVLGSYQSVRVEDMEVLEQGHYNHFKDIDNEMFEMMPGRHYFRGQVFRFSDVDLDSILNELAKSGMMDASSPGVMHVVAARVFKYPWGLVSVWIALGVIEDLSATEVYHY